MKQALYKHLASKLDALENCIKTHNTQWEEIHEDTILGIVKNYMPSGSGIDAGTKIDLDNSTGKRIVLTFGFHHMTEGMYDGWTEHKAIVVPSLVHDFELRITGSNRNDVKDYLYQTFEYALRQEIEA